MIKSNHASDLKTFAREREREMTSHEKTALMRGRSHSENLTFQL